MKKLFTLGMALLVASAGFAQVQKISRHDVKKNSALLQKAPRMAEFANQNVQSEPNMVRYEFGEGEVDYTTYDWQSNSGAITRTIVWPDGKVNFAFTVSSNDNYTDRGTAIATYDYNTDEWIPSGGRIESEKTGFGSIARYKQNGIVIAAHTATDLKIYIAEDKDNLTPNSVPAAIAVGSDWYSHPNVMTSGPNREYIHMVAAEFEESDPDGDGIKHSMRYWRSSDGETFDIVARELPFLSAEYGTEHGTNSYYWMETTDDNCLALVINNGNTDGMVLYSYDNGDTWERKVYFHDPAPGVALEESFAYPRWTSAAWTNDMQLMLAYEFNFSDHQGHYGPGTGGVAFWSEYMPYRGEGVAHGFDPTNPLPPVQGQPFIMDSAYISQDIYGSWWLWSDATHDMWPEYFGYMTNLNAEGDYEDPYAEEWETSFNIESASDLQNHGPYNSGICAFPVLCRVGENDQNLVAVWCALNDESLYDGLYSYNIFASYSMDGGLTWGTMVPLMCYQFEWSQSEVVYPQAAVIGNTLIICTMVDYAPGTSVQGDDDDSSDNHYHGLTFDLNEIFPEFDNVGETVSHNVRMNLYPNPAVDQLTVNLSQNADIVVYNIMGQKVMSMEGRVGDNSINVSNLSSGIYFVNAGSDTQKFIVK